VLWIACIIASSRFWGNPEFSSTVKLDRRHRRDSISSLRPQRESHFYSWPLFFSPQKIGQVFTASSRLEMPVMEVFAMVTSVLIADDQEVIRHMLCLIFASQADFEVCGEAENGQEAVEMAQILHPDLIMQDLSMPVMNGIEAACALKEVMPLTPIIVFSEYSDVFSEREARKTGVAALVSKTADLSVLVEKARAVVHAVAA
jgi:CheY-like chemotaxis protein